MIGRLALDKTRVSILVAVGDFRYSANPALVAVHSVGCKTDGVRVLSDKSQDPSLSTAVIDPAPLPSPKMRSPEMKLQIDSARFINGHTGAHCDFTSKLAGVVVKLPDGYFSAPLALQATESDTIRELLVWATANVGKTLSVSVLAEQAGMAVRTFERRFAREIGMTPARFILRAWVEAASRQLQSTSRSLEPTALSCGFGSADVMRGVSAHGAPIRQTPSAAKLLDILDKVHGFRSAQHDPQRNGNRL